MLADVFPIYSSVKTAQITKAQTAWQKHPPWKKTKVKVHLPLICSSKRPAVNAKCLLLEMFGDRAGWPCSSICAYGDNLLFISCLLVAYTWAAGPCVEQGLRWTAFCCPGDDRNCVWNKKRASSRKKGIFIWICKITTQWITNCSKLWIYQS